MHHSHPLLALTLAACSVGSITDPPHAPGPSAQQIGALYAAPEPTTPEITIEQFTRGELTFDVRTGGPKTGEAVIFLHGFPESSFEWRHQLQPLAAAGYHVIAPDLRGTGANAKPKAVEDYSLLVYVEDVLALADHYGAERFHVVGHDVGGLVAWGTSQFAGNRVLSLTAVSVPHPGAYAAKLADPDSCQSAASAWYGDLLKDGAAARLLAGEPPLLVDAWTTLGPEAEAEYRRLLGTPALLDAAINVWRANFIDGQPQGALPIPVLVPTLYIWGADDPYNCGREAEPLTRSLVWAKYTAEELPGRGHFLPEEVPDAFYASLVSHLRNYAR
ncbi:MAG: alpha/beta hydrolase [Polyangiales bacterium]